MCSVRKRADPAHAASTAARAELLEAVRELEATEAWRGDGAANLAGWLAARWQIAPATARELVRDARALRDRPALGDALRAAEISIDQCRALTVLSQPDDDQVWLECLPTWSISELQREARKKIARKLEREDGGAYLKMGHTPDERYLRGEFRLHPEDGAAVMAAIEGRIPNGTSLRDWHRAGARALVELARGDRAPRATVLLTVDAAIRDAARVGRDGYVGPETAHRLCCDADVQTMHKHGHRITGIGRTTRAVPPGVRRGVAERDGGTCTFPECDRQVDLHCHHIVHYADGGPTEAWNLILACGTHHKLLHEGGWSLRGEAGPHMTWIRPDGTPFEPRVRVTLDTS